MLAIKSNFGKETTADLTVKKMPKKKYRVIINYCPIAVGVGDVVECAASLII
jgi:hypothetical protein